MKAQASLKIVCNSRDGHHLGELAIADRRGKSSLIVDPEGDLSISELSEYDLLFKGEDTSTLEFAGAVEQSLLRAPGEFFGAIARQSSLGSIRVSIREVEGESVWQKLVIVRPEKFRDTIEFEAMVADICSWRTALALQLQSNSSPRWALDKDAAGIQAEEQLAVLRAAAEQNELFGNLDIVQRNSLARLERDGELGQIGREEADPVRLGRYLNGPGDRVLLPVGHPLRHRIVSLPVKVPTARKRETIDTPENQFVKRMVRQFIALINEALNQLPSQQAGELVDWGRAAHRKLLRIANSNYFAMISDASYISLGNPSLQRREGYGGILSAYLAMRAGLSLAWPELGRAVFAETRDVPTLYEFWCLIKLRQALEKEFDITLDLEQFVTSDKSISVRRGSFSRSLSEIWLGGKSYNLSLYYNRGFSPTDRERVGIVNFHSGNVGTWSKTMRPDFTIGLSPTALTEFGAAETNSLRFVHLDAKYRLKSVGSLVNESDQSRTHVPDDLDKMHAYVAAINHSYGAYALFPGDVSAVYMQGSDGRRGVGALSLLPASALQLGAQLRLILELATATDQ